MQLFNDIHNRAIRLTAERRQHLQTAHPEMTEAIPRIVEVLASPNKIVRSRTDTTVELFYRHYPSTTVTSKFLCIVVKVLPDDNFVITAYYTPHCQMRCGTNSFVKPMDARGRVVVLPSNSD
jgi:hypothetical protein